MLFRSELCLRASLFGLCAPLITRRRCTTGSAYPFSRFPGPHLTVSLLCSVLLSSALLSVINQLSRPISFTTPLSPPHLTPAHPFTHSSIIDPAYSYPSRLPAQAPHTSRALLSICPSVRAIVLSIVNVMILAYCPRSTVFTHTASSAHCLPGPLPLFFFFFPSLPLLTPVFGRCLVCCTLQ